MEAFVRSPLNFGRRRARWPTRALTCLALLVVAATAVYAAVPLSLDRDVTDITAWLKPLKEEAAGRSDGETAGNKRWLKLDLVNPTQQDVHRILTLESASSGILRFLGGTAPVRLEDIMSEDEKGKGEMLDIGGERAADIALGPLESAKFVVFSEGAIDNAVWRIWKPEALAASKQTETLLMGLLGGAAIAVGAWLAGLAVFRRSTEPAWAAIGLGALVLLLLGGSFLSIAPEALQVIGAVMIAAGLRYVVAGDAAVNVGTVTSDLLALTLTPCAHLGPVSACALVLGGFGFASGRGYQPDHSGTTRLLALGARVLAESPRLGRFSVVGWAELAAALVVPVLVVQQGAEWRPEGPAWGAGAALRFHFL